MCKRGRDFHNTAACVLSESIVMQKAFSLPSMCFDGVPDDSRLECLFGDRDCGPVNAVEEAGWLIVRPWVNA